MAVDQKQTTNGQKLTIGLNVTLMTILAVALVAGVQYIGYTYSVRADISSTGVSSLSPATEGVLKGLDQKVWITSLYFQTDLEEKDQEQYRSTVADLLDLYQSTNRSMVEASSINPLQDHDAQQEMLKGLAKLPYYAEQSAQHKEVVDRFESELLQRITDVLRSELDQLAALNPQSETGKRIVPEVERAYESLQAQIDIALRDVEDALKSQAPAYGAAVAAIRSIYAGTIQQLDQIGSFSARAQGRMTDLGADVKAYFDKAQERYADLRAALSAEQDKINTLPEVELDGILQELEPTDNPILVQTEAKAVIVPFRDVWPSAGPGVANAGYSQRLFKGEQKITAAILRLTQETRPAVMFVRFGGQTVLTSGGMPGQSRGPYDQLLDRLDDLNFAVDEWDLSTSDQPPTIDPAPSRTIFVVLPPESQQNPFGPNQSPPFTPQHVEKLKKALGDAPRAIFLTGANFNAFGQADEYKYDAYLEGTWGISVVDDRLLAQFQTVGPGKFAPTANLFAMNDFDFGDHPVVTGLGAQPLYLPASVELKTTEETPEGVDAKLIAWVPRTEGTWSVGDIGYYQKQVSNEFFVKAPDDYTGRFGVVAEAVKGDGKIVVVGSAHFLTDQVAFAQQLMAVSGRLAMRQRFPGNAALFTNALYWLDDNTEWLNSDAPIENATLTISKDSGAVTTVQVIAYILLPGLALVSGLVVWLVRRN